MPREPSALEAQTFCPVACRRSGRERERERERDATHTNARAHAGACTREHTTMHMSLTKQPSVKAAPVLPSRARTSTRSRCLAASHPPLLPPCTDVRARQGHARHSPTRCVRQHWLLPARRESASPFYGATLHTRPLGAHRHTCEPAPAPRRPRLSLSRLFCPLPSSFSSPISGRRSRNWAALPCVCVCLSCLCVCPLGQE